MNIDTDAKDRFEDRLLAAVLDDFDHLSGQAAARSRHDRTGRAIGARSGRRAVPVLMAGAAAAAIAVAGVIVLGSHSTAGVTAASPAHGAVPLAGGGTNTAGTKSAGTNTAPTMTARQSALYRLASVSATAATPLGRYVVLAETDTETAYPGESKRTSVVDTRTGASTTYQHAYPAGGQAPSPVYTQAPATLREGPDPTSTEAWYAALPTNPVALRAKLLSLAKQQAEQAARQWKEQSARLGRALRAKKIDRQPVLSDADNVYQEADTLLWSPLVEPPLRAALYKVLAATSGFTITTNTTDPAGRPAIAMTRRYTGVAETDITYENPATGAVLAQVWKDDADVITAVYQVVTSTKTIPPDPYTS